MIDVGKLSYRLVVVDEGGGQYDLKDFATRIGWEENASELAARLTFQCCNRIPSGYLSDLVKLGCLAVVYASDGVKEEEAVRGYIKDWNPVVSASEDTFHVTAYDELYALQKSQDSVYIPAGMTTQSALGQILDPWGISVDYQGPEVVHGKLKYQNRALADCMLDILSDAREKGGTECIIRAEKGLLQVRPKGTNQDVYVFGADNSVELSHKRSISNMVTRVKVVGRETNDGRYPVEAVVDGETKFGVLQKVITREKSQTMEEARTAALEILKEEGQLDEKITLRLPDVPYVRKGDLIYVNNVCGINGYLEVLSVQHDVDTVSMTVTAQPSMEGG